jgi:hypothetical protein
MTVELISSPQANHAFNLINRDQSTSIFKPEEWNEDVLVVDAWLRTHFSPTWRFFKPSLSPARTRFKEITHWAKIGFC